MSATAGDPGPDAGATVRRTEGQRPERRRTFAGLSLPKLDELSDRADSAQEAARRKAAGDVDSKALSVLSAADFRLGKAYGVGQGPMTLTSRPSAQMSLADHLTEGRIAPVVAAIDDLGSALPPHAGHSVRASGCKPGVTRA